MTTPFEGKQEDGGPGPEQSAQSQSSQSASAPGGADESSTREEQTGKATHAQSQALIDELNALGAKFAEAIDVAWKSEQRKRLEEDLRSGIMGVADSLEQQLKDFSRRDETRKFLDRAEDVADKVRTSKVSQEIATALTQGLRSLSEQLDKLSHELRERDEAARQPESDSPTGTEGDPSTSAAAANSPAANSPAGNTATASQTTPETADETGQDIPIQRG